MNKWMAVLAFVAAVFVRLIWRQSNIAFGFGVRGYGINSITFWILIVLGFIFLLRALRARKI